MQTLWGYLQLVFSCSLFSFCFWFTQTKAKQVRACIFCFTVPQEFHNNQIPRKRHEGSEKDVKQRSVCLVQLIDPDHCISPCGWGTCRAWNLCSQLCLPFYSSSPAAAFSWAVQQREAFWHPAIFGLWNNSKNTTKPMLIWGQQQLQA